MVRHAAYKLLTIFFLLILAPVAYGNQNDTPEPYCDPGVESGSSAAFGGKPVSLATGAETFSRTDLTIGNIFPISVQRRYNSLAGYDSPLGFGWALNYDKHLYTYSNGSVTLRKECGWKIRFEGSCYVGFTPAAGETGTLTCSGGNYIYTDKSGEREIYDSLGRITDKYDTRGNSLHFTYMPDYRTPLTGILLANLDQYTPVVVSYNYRLQKIEEYSAGGPTGYSVSFSYDPFTGRLDSFQDNSGRTVTYGHDSVGNLTSVSGPSGDATYKYQDSHNQHLLTTIDEGNGEYVNEYYSSDGKVHFQRHAKGVIEFIYEAPPQKTVLTTTMNTTIANSISGAVLNTQTRTVEFDANRLPSIVTDNDGNVTKFERDNNMMITREEYWENQVSGGTPTLVLKTANAYSYDNKGNMLLKIEAQGTAIERGTLYSYLPTLSSLQTTTVHSVVNTTGYKVTTNSYYDTGNLHTTVETGYLGDGTQYSYTTTYDYWPNGKLKSVDGPRTGVGDITSYTYDPTTGALASVTYPLIGTTTYSAFDSRGNPWTVTDANNNVTSYTYDDLGRVKTTKAPGDTNATSYFYVSAGCSSCGGGANKIDYILFPEGTKIDYDYDAYGNLKTIKDNAGNTINYTYDSEGNRLSEEIDDVNGSLQKKLNFEYDALNRLKKIVNPDGSHADYAYNARASRTSSTSPNGYTTTYDYDELNRMTMQNLPGGFTRSSTQMITSYSYDSNSNLTAVSAPKPYIDATVNSTTYKYDDMGRVYQVISPDTGTTTYTYDEAGNMISKKDAKNVTISYQYDEVNRLKKIDFPTDTDIIYTYDTPCLNGKGRLCSMSDASGTTSYECTAKGQVKKETKVINTVTSVTEYSYDQNGNVKTITYPGGRLITYIYTNDKVTSVKDGMANIATNISYKPFGGMTSITYGNNLIGSIVYDNQHQYRISAVQLGTVSNLTSIMSLSYDVYDNNGNIKSIVNTLDQTKNKTFTYDTVDALWTASGPGGSYTWMYDLAGNRISETLNGSYKSYDYTAGTNKLAAMAGPIWFDYDANGNTTSIVSGGSRNLGYWENQRLWYVGAGGGFPGGQYVYNGNGQRVRKVVNNVATIFHYNQSGQIIAESDGSGSITAEYIYLNGQPLAKIEGANTYYYHNDHLGTPQKMTGPNQAQDVVWAADYKPFGETMSITSLNGFTNNLRFPGQYFDAETGLNYNYFRDYNPVIGRYVEADPIGLAGGINLFVYVDNNTLRRIDNYGLFWKCMFWRITDVRIWWYGRIRELIAVCKNDCNGAYKEVTAWEQRWSYWGNLNTPDFKPPDITGGLSATNAAKEAADAAADLAKGVLDPYTDDGKLNEFLQQDCQQYCDKYNTFIGPPRMTYLVGSSSRR